MYRAYRVTLLLITCAERIIISVIIVQSNSISQSSFCILLFFFFFFAGVMVWSSAAVISSLPFSSLSSSSSSTCFLLRFFFLLSPSLYENVFMKHHSFKVIIGGCPSLPFCGCCELHFLCLKLWDGLLHDLNVLSWQFTRFKKGESLLHLILELLPKYCSRLL